MAYPVLLDQNKWYKSTNSRAHFKTIRIADSYVPPVGATVDEKWSANTSEFPEYSITCYVMGDELIIAGNGSGKIAAPEDAAYLFSATVTGADLTNKALKSFCNVTHFYGAELLETSGVKYFQRAFSYMPELVYINTSTWNLSAAEDLTYVFGTIYSAQYNMYGNKLAELDVSGWGVDAAKSLSNAFLGNKNLKKLDISKWPMSALQEAKNMCTNCESLLVFDARECVAAGVKDMGSMLANCYSLREVNFGKMNNTLAVAANTAQGVYLNDTKLERVTMGENFALSSLIKPTIEGADGNWHTANGESYTPANVPKNKAGTYYATPELAKKAGTPVMVSGETMTEIAYALRAKTGTVEKLTPGEIAEMLREVRVIEG